MFRGKESSNRIELYQLVQDLLNFTNLGDSPNWGWVGWVDMGGGRCGCGRAVPCMHAHTHVHTHTCLCFKHDNFMQMAAPKGNPWGNLKMS